MSAVVTKIAVYMVPTHLLSTDILHCLTALFSYTLQIEKINQLFMNFVNFNGQERMQLGMESIGKFNLNQCMC